MKYYPIHLNIAGKNCAVIGGGQVATRKIKLLLECDAKIFLFSPTVTEYISELAKENLIIWQKHTYMPGDLLKQPFYLVICATDDSKVNEKAALEAKSTGALVDVVDKPNLSDFIVPANFSRGDLQITVSTSGKSPALAKSLKNDLKEQYGEEYGIYLELISQIRTELKDTLSTSNDREDFWRRAFDLDILNLLKEGKVEQAKERIINAVSSTGP
ncbi:bifunctional precorrin-2 dehydrogenase/sirohydrochlorin ferrochelatase [Selenomonadales bacterium OttesenSCG-928-I06]|nr:bifunctional precorrin-2 dehydrogenase/sirohydrochlorin ferrochelatase [Selenomonadales bacterium OttesenSCG-928-I06]